MLERCYITAELADRAGLFRVDSAEGRRLVGRKDSNRDYAGVVFPYYLSGNEDSREYRLRRDHPDLEQRGSEVKEKAKYLSPPGGGNRFYFPPGVSLEWLAAVNVPIVMCEGEKKCLALSRLGLDHPDPSFIPISVAGVWNWRGVVGKGQTPRAHALNIRKPHC